ncbi:Gfo/Idh/MocA family oxidoreductase [bacterium]|nr:Gfo/Idh/MocA family oxidoreductase [bacterium]RQV94413.1 MAG: gfo/Idh/MocA family oxidoreductase [bacterium]
MNKIKVGVVGTGHLGRFHAVNYAQIPEVDLVGVTDIEPGKARSVASETGCTPYHDLESLLNKVEAVSVVVPTNSHFNVCQKVLKSGIHCLVEKPIAQTTDEADRLIAMADQNRVIFQVGHVERFNPAMHALQGMKIEPRFIESHRLALFNPRGTEVAVVLDLMIHDIDVILSLVQSPVQTVDASGVAVVSDSIDIANARIRFENNCVANLTASRISQKKMRKMRLFQKDTYIAVDFLQKKSEIFQLVEKGKGGGLVVGDIGVEDKKREIIYQSPPPPQKEGLRKELETFIQTIRGKTPPAVTGREGRAALALAMVILEKSER